MAKVLHASKSGYFPACIETAPTNKSNLVGGTLEQIMELYWKVKSWRLDYMSGTEIIDFGENGVETITYTASSQSLGSVPATNETDLVCNPYDLLPDSADAEVQVTYTSGATDILYIGISLLSGQFYKENETYYMGFSFDLPFVTTVITQYPIGSITINGLSVPLYGYFDGNPPSNITGNISASISPIEYWAYASD